MNALYNLCRLSKSRQEEAALAGAVPALQSLVNGNSPLKQFALPIICDFAHASKTCRKVLWQHQIFHLYITLLKDPFWNLSALEAILAWMQDETARVEDALLEDASVEALLNTFSTTKATSFENILEPLLKVRTNYTIIVSRSLADTAYTLIWTRYYDCHQTFVISYHHMLQCFDDYLNVSRLIQKRWCA